MNPRAIFFLLAALTVSFPSAAIADDPAWMQAAALARDTDADARNAGIHGIDAHVPALEQALADGANGFPRQPGADGTLIVLTDGLAETLLALAQAAKANQKTVAHPNPYPEIGLMLAFYYNEAGKPEDAIRVIQASTKLVPVPGTLLGQHMAPLYSEEANAYGQLKRWTDSLAACDAGLALKDLSPKVQGRFDRVRGLSLVELGRLDDGEAAYHDALKLDPNDPVAERELAYIAKLRAGGASKPVVNITPKSASAP